MYISPSTDLVSLSQLPVGSLGKVVSMELTGLLRRRVLDLGMVPGTPIQCIRKNPAGDPIAYLVRETIVALRSEDAKLIKILPFA